MWLITLTFVLGLAVVALALLTLHRARLERRRSDARVAALAAAIDDPQWLAAGDLGEYHAEAAPPSPGMSLVVPATTGPSRAPAFVAAALVIAGVGTLLFAGMNGGRRPARDVKAAGSSIELVSMRHALDGDTLIVSGLVRNPTTLATPVLSAVVSVVGADGRVVARGTSPLDAAVLDAGKETTFRVSVPEVGDSSRYRVAFVNGSRIVPHVDRRSDLSRTALANDSRGN